MILNLMNDEKKGVRLKMREIFKKLGVRLKIDEIIFKRRIN
jgi:hypothetical protein